MGTTAPTRPTVTIPDHCTSRLHQYGAVPGDVVPGKPKLRNITLPGGWTIAGHGFVHDQHGRLRLSITRYADQPRVVFYEPESHARDVAERGAALVLDAWATPGALLGLVGERITTYQRLIYVNERGIVRWQDEQPQHAAKLRADLISYRRKLAAYTDLLQHLTDVVTSGWTPPWTDLTDLTPKETAA
jgi:hypothetical protein